MRYLVSFIFSLVITGQASAVEIITTTTDIAAITREVVGEKAEVSCIAMGKEDPHFLQAKPSLIVRARKADVWIRVGMELEIGWEEPLLRGARNTRIQVGQPAHIDASVDVLKLDVPTKKVSRAEGDVHPYGNPHYWLDPLNGRLMAGTIADRLSKLYPEHAEAFQKNTTAFKHKLDEKAFGKKLLNELDGSTLWAWVLKNELTQKLTEKGLTNKLGGWFKELKPYNGAKIITYHKSWGYFCNRFGLQIAAELEPKPGIPPSGRHLAKITRLAKQESVKVIFLEPFYSRKSADLVASRSGATTVVCPNCCTPAGSYLSMIDTVVKRMSTALKE